MNFDNTDNAEPLYSTCRHCQKRIVRLDGRWMHCDQSSDPEDAWYCRITVAGPANAPNPITYHGPV